MRCVQYRSEPKAQKLKKAEFLKTLELKVVEPAEIEWTAPIIFAQKEDGSLRFLQTTRS